MTFKSEVIEITLEEGELIRQTCQEIEDYKAKIGARKWGGVDLHAAVGVDVATRFESLIEKIDEKIDGKPVFAKMSCRSAKDVVNERLKRLFDEKIAEKEFVGDNEKIGVLLQCGADAMKMTSGLEIMKVFTQSERILGDMGTALQYPDRFRQNVILREWCDLDISMEFRGFVSNNEFTALSQYNYFVHFPKVVQNKDSIQKKLQEFWSTSCKAPLHSLSSYIIDFALLPSGGVKVIEVNPFYETTSSALFNWKADEKVIKEGPFEFRVCKEVPKKRPEIEPEYHPILGW